VPVAHKFFELKEKGITKGEIVKKLGETSFHNLQKLCSFIFRFLHFSCGFSITRKNGGILTTGFSRYIISVFIIDHFVIFLFI
jgi:hypothetical protein